MIKQPQGHSAKASGEARMSRIVAPRHKGRPATLLPGFSAFGAFAAFLLTVNLYSNSNYHALVLPDPAGDQVLVVHDEMSGLITVARNTDSSAPEYIYVPIRRFGFTDGSLIRAGDFSGDGFHDLVLPAYAANRVLLLRGADLRSSGVPVSSFSAGPGPAFAAPAWYARNGTQRVFVATTAGANVRVGRWDPVSGNPIVAATDYPDGFGRAGILGFDTAASTRGADDPLLGILHRDPDAAEFPVLKIVQRAPSPEYGFDNAIQSWETIAAHTHLISGHPAGENQPAWFLAYGSGSPVLELFSTNPGERLAVDLGHPVARVNFIPDVDDEVLVLFQNGTLVQYEFSPETALAPAQFFDAPSGLVFAGAAGGDGTLFALLADASGQLAQYQTYEKGAEGYQLIDLKAWPEPPAPDGAVTVVLYTADPFASPPPFAFETFVAGDWTTEAQFDEGTVSVLAETFGDAAQGLGNPGVQLLQPAFDPGPGGAARGNQWEPSSSLFHLAVAAAADGPAAVQIQPNPGAYPNTIGASFQAGEDVTVIYRLNQGPWQSGTGPFLITGNTTVDYYGEHSGGALSSIQTAHYLIQQSLAADSDGDGVPDFIEVMAGLNPFAQESLGDGISDFDRILYGAPGEPPGPPEQAALPFDRFRVEVVWDNPDSAARPAVGQKLLIANPLNHSLGSAQATPNPGTPKYGDITLKHGVTDSDAFAKFWFPANYALAEPDPGEPAGPALVAFGGIPPAPRPLIPVDPGAGDPLEAWRQDALAAVEAHEKTILEFTVGPSSTIAALIFEYWYGTRLVELGRLEAVTDRPRLADTPRSPRAGRIERGDFEAIRSPQGEQPLAHELAHVVRQVNEAVVHGPEFGPLRETAESFYSQAIDGMRAETPLAPPLNALRRVVSGGEADGYVLPHDVASLTALRDQALDGILPRDLIVAHGVLLWNGENLVLDSGGEILLLADRDGRPYRLAGTGLVAGGSTATVTGEILPSNEIPVESLKLAVEHIELHSIPAAPIVDSNQNGLPDDWEWAFLGSLDQDIWADLNGDGFVLGEAYLAGIDPLDPFASPPGAPAIPRNLRVTPNGPGGPRVEWDGSFAAEYELWNSQDLIQWTPHPGAVQRGGDREHAVDVDLEGASGFFRLHIRLPLP